jgi:hypothetical protein
MSRQVSICTDCGTADEIHHHNCATHERDSWVEGEERIDRIAQSDASGDHYAEDSDAESALSQAMRELRPGLDKMRVESATTDDSIVSDFFASEVVKQARYQDSRGEDWIDEFARTATADEFRGAMRFTIGKYNRRAGKKDSLVSEITKIEDYARRWREYELAYGGES